MKKFFIVFACLMLLCTVCFAEVNTAGAVCMNLFIPVAGGIVACRIAGIVLPCKWAKTNGEIALTDINPNTSLNGTLVFNPIVDTENEKYGLSATIRY